MFWLYSLFNLFLILLLFCRVWGLLGMLFIVECIWVSLYYLFIASAMLTHGLVTFFCAILILVLSAVEFIISLICFILYYNLFNTTTEGFKNKLSFQKYQNQNFSYISKYIKNCW